MPEERTAAEIKEKIVACPQCGGPSAYTPSNAFRPFCSQHCKHLDLGAWASEQFTLPEQLPNSDPSFSDQ